MTEDATLQKRVRGGQPMNQNATKTGVHSAKRAVTKFGKRAINLRTRAGLEWKAIYEDFLSQATGVPASELTRAPERRKAERMLGKAEVVEIEAMTTEAWITRRIDAEIHHADSLVRRRDKKAIPLLAERSARWAAYEKRVAEFRQRHAPKPPSIQDLMRQREIVGPSESTGDRHEYQGATLTDSDADQEPGNAAGKG